ncbi:MAG: type II toxin-antitoxin system Phd/YefM family antitoxin [Thermoleophilaceae bacterium]
MRTVRLDSDGDELAAAVSRVAAGTERVVVETADHDRAVVISAEDADTLERLEDAADLEAARQALAEEGESIPLERIEAELDH